MMADCKYQNVTFSFNCVDDVATVDQILQHVARHAPSASHHPIRFAVFRTTPEAAFVECTYSVFGQGLSSDLAIPWHPQRAIVAHVVPTSVGAAVGGFAGDASPATRLLAEVSELLVTNPNAVNASDILSISPNTLYVEGGLLDQFFLGSIALRPVAFNRVGVIVEKQPQRYIDSVRYSMDAASATCGIPLVGYAVTPRKIGPRVKRFPSGA